MAGPSRASRVSTARRLVDGVQVNIDRLQVCRAEQERQKAVLHTQAAAVRRDLTELAAINVNVTQVMGRLAELSNTTLADFIRALTDAAEPMEPLEDITRLIISHDEKVSQMATLIALHGSIKQTMTVFSRKLTEYPIVDLSLEPL